METMKFNAKKYIVLRRMDWDDYQPTMGEALPEELEDCVVIRLQDVFAQSALYEYANNIKTFLEILDEIMPGYENPKIDALMDIADYFAEMGDKCHDIATRLPTL